MFNRSMRLAEIAGEVWLWQVRAPHASGKVAELVKNFEHVNEILDGFRYSQTGR